MSVTIEEIRNLNDPQRSYKWQVIMPDVVIPSPNSGASNTAIERFEDFRKSAQTKLPPRLGSLAQQASSIVNGQLGRLGLSLQRFNISTQAEEIQGLPFPGTDRSSMYEGGRNTHFPDIEDVQPVTITFYLDQSNRVYEYFRVWRSKMISPNGTKYLPGDYKLPIRVNFLNGLNKRVFGCTLLGCFPTQVTPLTLTQDSGRLSFTQEFSIDRIEYNNNLDDDAKLTPKEALLDKVEQVTAQELRGRANFLNGQTRDLF